MLYKQSERIKTIINDQTLKDEKEREERASSTFHASSALDCLRQLVYDRMKYKKQWTNPKPEWIRSREAGSAMHLYYVDILRKAGILLESEQAIPINLNEVGGRYDVSLFIEEKQLIIDIKTVSHKKFVEVPKGDKFQENYAQLQLYLHFLNLEEGILLYINRSDNDIKEFTVYRDGEHVKKVLDRLRRGKYYLDNNIIPPEERSFKCMFCPFQEICELDGPKEVRLNEDIQHTP